MKIGIDGYALTISYRCGVRTYAEQLLHGLAKIDSKNEYIIFVSRPVPIPHQKNFKIHIYPSYVPFFKRQLLLPQLVKSEKIDLFHYPESYGAISLGKTKTIVTLHDLDLSLTYPWLSRYFATRIYTQFIRYFIVARASQLIVGTNFTRNEVLKYLKNRHLKIPISTIYHGIQTSIKPLNIGRSTKKNFVCMGDFTRRKNIRRVIAAYALVPEQIRQKHRLIILVSKRSFVKQYEQFKRLMDESTQIQIRVGLPDEEVHALMAQSLCFMYVSLYEGFGLPILEAMSNHCPVITSNFGAMAEVAGRAALLVNSKQEKSIAKAMITMANNATLRKKLVALGNKRLQSFNWDLTARKTLSLYESIR